ncbi:hypothetical protein CC85DRAFT_329834 [Cutaneotrichosporon oleaginosum]|uniref:Uncharacterized protein n=1 Tax=Cutaneotrichosporon oleaginosum TaxID=879819 RepID=A0A0J0XHL2_9TREE|nr:uncharacterized protein CC85DRAFT_329834 [Cutaneotrichosporon oleaginosum]KLT40553.1 hypothetical protein CC85DRAFT_329834 [Cutaneotrichosporon oleaginosum]TXT08376.1 hypothetical protein COLE_05300 [Cutaneotrichosporon oleaginosum]
MPRLSPMHRSSFTPTPRRVAVLCYCEWSPQQLSPHAGHAPHSPLHALTLLSSLFPRSSHRVRALLDPSLVDIKSLLRLTNSSPRLIVTLTHPLSLFTPHPSPPPPPPPSSCSPSSSPSSLFSLSAPTPRAIRPVRRPAPVPTARAPPARLPTVPPTAVPRTVPPTPPRALRVAPTPPAPLVPTLLSSPRPLPPAPQVPAALPAPRVQSPARPPPLPHPPAP